MSVAPNPTNAEPGTGSLLLKVGVTVLQRAAPKGVALVQSIFRGKTILIVGQGRAGKTTFADYLQFGLFEDAKETPRTMDPRRSARFNVRMGRDAALELTVKTLVDMPGQIGPIAHADEAFERRPHVLIVFTDLTTPLNGDPDRASVAYIRDFIQRLEARWRAAGRRKNRIKSIVVVMNKADVASSGKLRRCKDVLRDLIDSDLRTGRGAMLDDVAILPCAVVTNPEGTKLVDSVIAHVAKALIR